MKGVEGGRKEGKRERESQIILTTNERGSVTPDATDNKRVCQ